MSSVANLLRGVGQAAGVAGQFIEGYGKDQSNDAARVLAQAKADEEAKRNAVLNRVALGGIDPTLQGQLSGAKARGETGALVDRENLMAPIRTAQAVATAKGVAPIEVQKAVDTEQGITPIKTAGANAAHQYSVDHPAPSPSSITVLPGANGAPAQGVVTGGNTRPLGSTMPIANVVKNATSTNGGGSSVSGLGQGGVFGAGSGIGAVKEMQAANPNLKAYEKGFLGNMPTSQLGALDRYRQKLAGDLQTHGFISAATASEAERELAATNPDLVTYGRNLKQWIVADLNLSRGGTDERQRLDMAVSGLGVPLSSMPPAQRATYINQIWEARDSRLAGVQQAADAAQAMLKRATNGAGGSGSPAQTPPIAAPASHAQQLWDAAVAKHGQAKVLAEFGPRPPG